MVVAASLLALARSTRSDALVLALTFVVTYTTASSPVSGVADHLRRDGLLFADTPSAIEHARGIVRGAPPVLPVAAPAAAA
jgi:hypothetical protein